jgi:hypothetical protein
MKTIITVLTTAVLAIGASGALTGASAAAQGSDEAAGYALSLRAVGGSIGSAWARDGRDYGAYASARETRQMRNGAFNIPAMHDFQLDGR